MKKLIAFGSVALLLPGLAFAQAYNDAQLSTNAVLSVGGITVNVSTANSPEITVTDSTFTVSLAPGSSMTASAPNLNKFTFDSGASPFLTADRCDGGSSNFVLEN